MKGHIDAGSVLLAVFCLLSAASAQWLETTIALPDSSGPAALCFDPQDNKLFCANWDGDNVIVIDCSTNLVADTIARAATPLRSAMSSGRTRSTARAGTAGRCW